MILDSRVIYDSTIVIYGAQKYFQDNINKLKNFHPQYIYPDGNCQLDIIQGKYKILDSIDDIKKLDKPFVLIAKGLASDIKRISRELQKREILYDYLENYTSNLINITNLLCMDITNYTDLYNNKIILDKKIKLHNTLYFSRMNTSKNNIIQLENITIKSNSKIMMIGDGGKCRIRSGTCIEQVEITVNSAGNVEIGKDCLFSYNIVLMQTDHHHIFDLKTKKRINVNKNIVIGNHVWIGRDVELLAGTQINNNSVVGARTVTSSIFPPNVIIAGNPGRIIRKEIIWAEDAIRKGSLNDFDEAKDKRVLQYP